MDVLLPYAVAGIFRWKGKKRIIEELIPKKDIVYCAP